MAQIQKGDTFADGQLVTGARLNQLIDSAILNPEAVTNQTLITAVDLADKFLIYQDSTMSLRSITLSSILEVHFPPITVSQLISTAEGGVNISSFNMLQLAGKTISLTAAGSGSGDISVTTDNDINLTGTNISVTGKAVFNGTGSLKLPTGTTAQRPSSPMTGELRFNTTTGHTEAYNGTAWEAVGGSPFDATGGNKVLAPDATVVTASFSSTDGISVVVTSTAHTVLIGQVIKLTTSVAGYSGNWTVYAVTTNDFTVALSIPAIANSGSCTYNKAGNFKTHIFTTGGTFTSGDSDGNVEILVVGGGGGGGGAYGLGGGGGAVCYNPYYFITKNTSYTVTIGNGGNGYPLSPTDGSPSTFGSVIANGGKKPDDRTGWGWGGSTGSGSFGVKSINPYDNWTATSGLPVYPWNGSRLKPDSGASSGGAPVWVKHPSFDTYYFDQGTCVGLDISGIPTRYGQGGSGTSFDVGLNGGGGRYNTPVPNTGNGGGVGSSVSNGNGASGIVIVRYPYWL